MVNKLLFLSLGALLLVSVIVVLVFWYGEVERKKLIDSYQASSQFLEHILSNRQGPVSALMNSDETTVCAIDGYGSVEGISVLNAGQKHSLRKDKLPSEDLAWYLLFFTNDSVSRIYLIDKSSLVGGVEGANAGCIGREGEFVVMKTKEINGDAQYILNIRNGR